MRPISHRAVRVIMCGEPTFRGGSGHNGNNIEHATSSGESQPEFHPSAGVGQFIGRVVREVVRSDLLWRQVLAPTNDEQVDEVPSL
jgi:hypothetical protein